MQDGRGTQVRAFSPRSWLAASIVVTITADQLSKHWARSSLGDGRTISLIGPYLGLRLVHNPGGAFGLFPGATVLLTILGMALVGAALIWAVRLGQAPIRLGMIVGGGVGNLIDRFAHGNGLMDGEVTDFIASSVWPTFNIADSAIVVGVLLLLMRPPPALKDDSPKPTVR